jgi:hypothetical protein
MKKVIEQRFQEEDKQKGSESITKPEIIKTESSDKKSSKKDNYKLPGSHPASFAPTPTNKQNNNDISNDGITIESELPPWNTIERKEAIRNLNNINGNDVSITELRDVEENVIDGLKTATCKTLVEAFNEKFRNDEQIRE